MITTLEIERSFLDRIVDAINVALIKLQADPTSDERGDDAYETFHELLDEMEED